MGPGEPELEAVEEVLVGVGLEEVETVVGLEGGAHEGPLGLLGGVGEVDDAAPDVDFLDAVSGEDGAEAAGGESLGDKTPAVEDGRKVGEVGVGDVRHWVLGG